MRIATRSQAIAGVYSILSMSVRVYEGRSVSLRQVLVGMDTIGGKLACSCIESKQSPPSRRHGWMYESELGIRTFDDRAGGRRSVLICD